jgi:uncharacterized membrane protein
MKSVLFESILVALISTIAMIGAFHVMDNLFEIRIRQKAIYATVFGIFMFALNIVHPFTKLPDNMIVNRILSTVIGLAILGVMMLRKHKYETSGAWSAILSSLIYIYLVIYGINPPIEINPMLFDL